ncbi:MAG: gamma carbonic anhydrase family protein [Thermoplasmata archaeon]
MIYVAETATILGDVAIERGASVWYGTVVRGDLEGIEVGKVTNLQDGVVVHTDVGCPTRIGARVTVGHGAIVHGCEVGEDCIIGMGATISSKAIIGKGSIVTPGAVVPEGKGCPSGSLLRGVPAKSRQNGGGHRQGAHRGQLARIRGVGAKDPRGERGVEGRTGGQMQNQLPRGRGTLISMVFTLSPGRGQGSLAE